MIAARAIEGALGCVEAWRQQSRGSYAGWSSTEECPLLQGRRDSLTVQATMAHVSRGYPCIHQGQCMYTFFISLCIKIK